jgi:pilus assembly protein Flp/PilA
MSAKDKKKARGSRRGQGMTEYIIVVALVAIGAIGIITVFGDNIRQLFGASAEALAGNTNAQNNGVSSVPASVRSKSLRTFGQAY